MHSHKCVAIPAIISIARVHYFTFLSRRSNSLLFSFWFLLSSLFARICLYSLWAIDILAVYRTRRNWDFYTNIFTIKYKLLRPCYVEVRSTLWTAFCRRLCLTFLVSLPRTVSLNVCTFVWVYLCLYIRKWVRVRTRVLCVCALACLFICMYIHIHVSVCMIHTSLYP